MWVTFSLKLYTYLCCDVFNVVWLKKPSSMGYKWVLKKNNYVASFVLSWISDCRDIATSQNRNIQCNIHVIGIWTKKSLPSKSSVLSIWPGKEEEFWSPVFTYSFHCSNHLLSTKYLQEEHKHWTHRIEQNSMKIWQIFTPLFSQF